MKKRILGIIFCVMLLTALMTVTALAGTPTALCITDTAGAASVTVDLTANRSGSGWSWDSEKNELLLDGFHGEYIETTGSDLTIRHPPQGRKYDNTEGAGGRQNGDRR